MAGRPDREERVAAVELMIRDYPFRNLGDPFYASDEDAHDLAEAIVDRLSPSGEGERQADDLGGHERGRADVTASPGVPQGDGPATSRPWWDRLLCWLGAHRWSHPGGYCESCGVGDV